MARSKILLLVCLIAACKSTFPCSIWSMIAKHFSISLVIRCCSLYYGRGTSKSVKIALFTLCCPTTPLKYLVPCETYHEDLNKYK